MNIVDRNVYMAHVINDEPWEPMPGMRKLLCLECDFWFATSDHKQMCHDCRAMTPEKLYEMAERRKEWKRETVDG